MCAEAHLPDEMAMTTSPNIVLDDARHTRIGFDEAILCEQKLPAQISQIVRMSVAKGQSRLLTRLSEEKFSTLPAQMRKLLCYVPDAQTASLGDQSDLSATNRIAIVSAGSSDAKPISASGESHSIKGILLIMMGSFSFSVSTSYLLLFCM